ncbi:hypothetical protein AMTR_s00061p00054290 [Amborella trichopoda]|uniref:Uncharacterized protein n=1 Tax=Amborella trichopoda TaxID=13333 RepID=U5DF51_AMBTC|nr:hypothetical protein AMTR_s00061p00054290 [Amborella trichopoda]
MGCENHHETTFAVEVPTAHECRICLLDGYDSHDERLPTTQKGSTVEAHHCTAGVRCVHCRSIIFHCRSAVAPEPKLPERIAGAPACTAGSGSYNAEALVYIAGARSSTARA